MHYGGLLFSFGCLVYHGARSVAFVRLVGGCGWIPGSSGALSAWGWGVAADWRALSIFCGGRRGISSSGGAWLWSVVGGRVVLVALRGRVLAFVCRGAFWSIFGRASGMRIGWGRSLLCGALVMGLAVCALGGCGMGSAGQWGPDYAASPDCACLGGALGASVIRSVPAGRLVGASEGPEPSPFPPTDLRGRHLPTTPRYRSWTENQRRKSESVQTPSAHAQNLYCTSTFCILHGVSCHI